MTVSLSDLTARLLDAAKNAGAEAADAMAVTGTSLSIDLRVGKLEQAERSEATEIGLRVLMGGRQACVSASDLSDRTIEALAERAVAMAREAPNDPTVGLADPSQLAQGWDIATFNLTDPAPEPTEMAVVAKDLEAVSMVAAKLGLL